MNCECFISYFYISLFRNRWI
uniref:Uncharacterized protein n=2 Tax=Rhodnius prolixus TaxID=13249 RepID=T1I035_RHOPR